MKFNLQVLQSVNLYQPVINNRGVFNVVIIASVFVIPAISLYFEKIFISDKYAYYYKILQKILFGLDNIVESKRKRFLEFISNQVTKKTTEEAFLTITQPGLQMVEIFNNLKHTVGSISSHENIKLSIISCENSKLINYAFHSDDKPSVDISELNEKKSTAKQALSTKKMIFISDVDKRKKGQWFYDGNSTIKSLICFPVLCGNIVHFVVTITSKEAKAFKNSNCDIYEFILDTYCSRLLLEHYLSIIKKHHEKQEK